VSLPVRIVTLLVFVAAVVVGAVFVVKHFVISSPPTVDYSSMAHNGQVSVVLQEDPQNNSATVPEWVSYYVQDPQTKAWVHTTIFKVPANTTVHMTILGYDGCTPPRNNYFSLVQGTIGGKVTVQQYKNLTTPIGPKIATSVINGWARCSVGHTFAIPSLHLFIPVASPNTNLFNSAGCSVSPCGNDPHSMEQFSFRTPDQPGSTFRWQCFVPCGGGYLDGFGGPMQTLGYMMGEMEIS
jgi:hypothetical protein